MLYSSYNKKISSVKIITNIDGVEWRRDKWGRFAKKFLKWSEKIAVKNSNIVISDNKEIANYVCSEYMVNSQVIAYGGDHSLVFETKDVTMWRIPKVNMLLLSVVLSQKTMFMLY